VTDVGGLDVASASGGRAGPDVQPLYEDGDAFAALAAELGTDGDAPIGAVAIDEADLRSPVPAPRQVFAVLVAVRGLGRPTPAVTSRRSPSAS
jgi:2,4-didehydro-3-deoxy-L-rhamnonate hydrolase